MILEFKENTLVQPEYSYIYFKKVNLQAEYHGFQSAVTACHWSPYAYAGENGLIAHYLEN